MIISISGLPGSGTSTVAKQVSKILCIEMISAGDIFRKEAEKSGLSLEEFGKLADSDFSIDSDLDKEMIRLAKENENLILEGRLAGYVANHPQVRDKGILRVCLKAPFEMRCSRIAKREGISQELAEDLTMVREGRESRRHWKNYGVDVKTVTYDVVFNSANLDPFQISAAIYDLAILKFKKGVVHNG